MNRILFIFYFLFINGVFLKAGISIFNKQEVIIDISQIYQVNKKNSEFYWRNYTSEIPHDALPGGRDREGKITYIGQTRLKNGGLVPGQIDAARAKLFYYYIAVGYKASERVKILCSKHPEKFEWIKTNSKEVELLSGKHLVPGGFDDGFPLLIGRSNVNGEVIVGKFTIYYKYRGLAYATSEKAGRQDEEFEILSYNP